MMNRAVTEPSATGKLTTHQSARRVSRGCTLASCASLCAALAILLALAPSASATLPDNRAYEMVSPVEKGEGA